MRDDGTIKGVPDEQQTRDAIDAITNWIKDIVDPLPDFDVRAVEIIHLDGLGETLSSKVISIEVEHGSSSPYGIKAARPAKREYYVRRGATTFAATPDQLRNIVLVSRPAQIGLIQS